MEHAFPPPFRWEFLSALEVGGLVIAILLPVFACFGLIQTLTARSSPTRVARWIAVVALTAFLWLALPAFFEGNWRHTKATTPLVDWSCLIAAVFGVLAVFVCQWRLPLDDRPTAMVRFTFGCGACFVMIAILYPAAVYPRSVARYSQCRNNLKQIGIALHNYHSDFDTLPATRTDIARMSWRVPLLPYIDHEDLFYQYDQAADWESSQNTLVAQNEVPTLICPSRVHPSRPERDEQGRFYTDYVTVVGDGTFSLRRQPFRLTEVTDGLANTLAVTEATGLNIVWTEPRDAELDRNPLGINLAGDKTSDSRGIASS